MIDQEEGVEGPSGILIIWMTWETDPYQARRTGRYATTSTGHPFIVPKTA
jgi:hypothetical protein